MQRLFVLSSLLLALGSSACSPTLAPVYMPVETAGVNAAGVPYTAAQIDQAAASGAQAKGWTIISRAPGLTVAEVTAGGQTARVRIVSSEAGWQVLHEQSSPGLKYTADDRYGDVIHRRYNHWVRLLDEAIRQQLALSTGPTPIAPAAATAPDLPPALPPAPPASP
jgi:hypothetical protein